MKKIFLILMAVAIGIGISGCGLISAILEDEVSDQMAGQMINEIKADNIEGIKEMCESSLYEDEESFIESIQFLKEYINDRDVEKKILGRHKSFTTVDGKSATVVESVYGLEFSDGEKCQLEMEVIKYREGENKINTFFITSEAEETDNKGNNGGTEDV